MFVKSEGDGKDQLYVDTIKENGIYTLRRSRTKGEDPLAGKEFNEDELERTPYD